MSDLLDQIYADGNKAGKYYAPNVNNSVGTNSIRLSNISGF